MTYQESIEYLFSQLPMFQRIGPAAYKADLNNTLAIMEILDQPGQDFRSIHIAGTNGKGSVSHMLASVLQQSGYKTGLYTSPHLKDFRERIRINGKMIERTEVTRFINKYKYDFEKIKPSFFEWTVGLAFDYFSRKSVEIAVIETGLGGRLDSTNVINPLVSVITNVGLDHTNLLGNTIAKIAGEKAGIIKHDTPVVIGESQKETKKIFNDTAAKLNAPIYYADKLFESDLKEDHIEQGSLTFDINKNKQPYIKDLKIDLGGWYQQKNLPVIFMVAELLEQKGFNTHRRNVKRGLARVKKNTGLSGRWQIIQKDPLIICDTGHNAEGIQNSMKQLQAITHRKLHIVFGAVNDKDLTEVLNIMPKKATYYFCAPDIPRSLPANELRKQAASFGLKGKSYSSVSDACEQAKQDAWKDDIVFIGGSTFVVAEIL